MGNYGGARGPGGLDKIGGSVARKSGVLIPTEQTSSSLSYQVGIMNRRYYCSDHVRYLNIYTPTVNIIAYL